MRQYTVDEIDIMRKAVETLGGSAGAEDRLRTYMQNGTDPTELRHAAKQKMDPIMERQRLLQNVADEWQSSRSYLSEFGSIFGR